MSIVLIPAFEPDERLVTLVRSLAPRGPVVVVDDGSDASYAPVFAASVACGALVLTHARNRGKGAALRTGFAFIAARWPGADVVTADADGQHTPADIARVAAALAGLAGEAPALASSRRHTKESAQHAASFVGMPHVATTSVEDPFPDAKWSAQHAASRAGMPHVATTISQERAVQEPHADAPRGIVLGVRAFTGRVPLRSRAGNLLTRRAFRLATGGDVTDTQTGLRGFPAATLPWLQTVPGDRFEYEFRMLLAARSAGIDLVEVPIETVYLEGNASSHFRPLADSARIWAPLLRFTASALLAFGVDTVALLVLHALTGWLLFSVVGARAASASLNYLVNRRHVFPAGRTLPARTTAARYFSLAGLLLAANYGVLSALTDAGMSLMLAKIVTETTLFAVSFSVQRAVVFPPNRP